MSGKTVCSLLTLPVELVYRILDNFNDLTIICSVRNVCTRINLIIDSYYRYQVNLSCCKCSNLLNFSAISYRHSSHCISGPNKSVMVKHNILLIFYNKIKYYLLVSPSFYFITHLLFLHRHLRH
jgi:hypothetical protein